jgi:hypothetical protein
MRVYVLEADVLAVLEATTYAKHADKESTVQIYF